MNKALVIKPGAQVPEETELTAQPSLEFLQAAVGGYIEAVPDFSTIEHAGAVVPCAAFCNEEGKLEGLEPNYLATVLWDKALRRVLNDDRKPVLLVGPIIVLIGDEQFLAEL